MRDELNFPRTDSMTAVVGLHVECRQLAGKDATFPEKHAPSCSPQARMKQTWIIVMHHVVMLAHPACVRA